MTDLLLPDPFGYPRHMQSLLVCMAVKFRTQGSCAKVMSHLVGVGVGLKRYIACSTIYSYIVLQFFQDITCPVDSLVSGAPRVA